MTHNPKTSLMRRLQGYMFKLPLMMSCREFETFIADYFEGTLSPRQKFEFELHLKVCRECRDYLAAYEAARKVTTSTLQDEHVAALSDVPEDLVKAVLAARQK